MYVHVQIYMVWTVYNIYLSGMWQVPAAMKKEVIKEGEKRTLLLLLPLPLQAVLWGMWPVPAL